MHVTLLIVFIMLFVGIVSAQPKTPLIAFVEDDNLYVWQDEARHVLIR